MSVQGSARRQTARMIGLLALAAVLAGRAGAAVETPAYWDREEASRLVELTDTRPVREELARLAIAGNSAGLLESLRNTATRPDWPAPARESALYGFVQELRGLPPRAVAPEVMAFLRTHQPQVLVAHDDHPRTAIAMFNVRAAAYGVENNWSRQEAALEGAELLDRDPVLLVEAFRTAGDPAVRQGLQDSLSAASQGQLEAVCFLALGAIGDDAAMTVLAGQAALLNADARALEQLVRTGSGPSLSHILRRSTRVLTDRQLGRLLDTAVQEGSPRTAAIAIAELAPEVADLPNHAEALIDLLGDPELGSSAALALARNPSTTTLRRLGDLASSGDESLLASRARLALRINRTQFAPEVQE